MAYLTLNGYLLNTGNGVSYSAGDNIDITNNVISGRDWSTDIESATSGKSSMIIIGKYGGTAFLPTALMVETSDGYTERRIYHKYGSELQYTGELGYTLNSATVDKLTYLDQVSGKQDTLTFEYNAADEISGINGSAFAGASTATSWYSPSGTVYVDNTHGTIEGSTSALSPYDTEVYEEQIIFTDGQSSSVFTTDAVNYISVDIPAYGYDYSFDYEVTSMNDEGFYTTFATGTISGNDAVTFSLIPPDDNTGRFIFSLKNFDTIGAVSLDIKLCNRIYQKVSLQQELIAGDGISIAGTTISCSAGEIIKTNYNATDHNASTLRVTSGMAGNNTLMVTDGSVSSTYTMIGSNVSQGLLWNQGGGMLYARKPSSAGVYGLTSAGNFSAVTNNKSFTMALRWNKTFTAAQSGPAIAPSAIDSAEVLNNWSTNSDVSFAYNTSTNRLNIANPSGLKLHIVAELGILPLTTTPLTGLYGSSLETNNSAEKMPMTNYLKKEFYDFSTTQSNITQKQLWVCDGAGNSTTLPSGTYRCELTVNGYYE